MKKSKTVGSRLEEAFLHPYFDRLPAVPFIHVTLKVGRSVRAQVAFDDGAAITDPVLKARMKYQFDKVDVNARIASEMEEFITETASVVADTTNAPSLDVVKKLLVRRATSADEQYGVTSWQSALLRELARSNAFCNGGYRRMLPKKL